MNQDQLQHQTLDCNNGVTIAYHAVTGKSPGVMFFTGFKSDMTGDKALALENYCKNRGQAFVRFDYQGHGQSSGAFLDGCIGEWADDAITVLDKLSEGPQVLVGSSMGGWIMLLTALARPKRVAALLGIAAAPDFTEDLMLKEFTAEQREALQRDGFVDLPNCYDDQEPYRITKKLIDDGRNQMVLKDKLNLDIPVRLIHGLKDADVPWQTSQKISELMVGSDVEVTFIKQGDHRLSSPRDLDRLTRTLDSLLEQLENQDT